MGRKLGGLGSQHVGASLLVFVSLQMVLDRDHECCRQLEMLLRANVMLLEAERSDRSHCRVLLIGRGPGEK